MEKKKLFGKRDLLILLILVLIGAAALLFMRLRPDAQNGYAEVSVGGETVLTLPLSEDSETEISGVGEGYNLLRIEGGHARIVEASCPDGICVRHRPVSKDGESIICLPNQVVVTVRGGEKGDVDAIA